MRAFSGWPSTPSNCGCFATEGFGEVGNAAMIVPFRLRFSVTTTHHNHSERQCKRNKLTVRGIVREWIVQIECKCNNNRYLCFISHRPLALAFILTRSPFILRLYTRPHSLVSYNWTYGLQKSDSSWQWASHLAELENFSGSGERSVSDCFGFVESLGSTLHRASWPL